MQIKGKAKNRKPSSNDIGDMVTISSVHDVYVTLKSVNNRNETPLGIIVGVDDNNGDIAIEIVDEKFFSKIVKESRKQTWFTKFLNYFKRNG